MTHLSYRLRHEFLDPLMIRKFGVSIAMCSWEVLHPCCKIRYRSVLGKRPWTLKRNSWFWSIWALTWNQNSIRLYKSWYNGPLKCGTWCLPRILHDNIFWFIVVLLPTLLLSAFTRVQPSRCIYSQESSRQASLGWWISINIGQSS